MKLHHLSTAIVLMFLAHNTLAVDTAGSFAVKGVGLSKCSAFVEVVKAKEAAKLSRYIGWVAGYISASNQHVSKTFDLTPWQNIRTLTLALVNHCDPAMQTCVSARLWCGWPHPWSPTGSTKNLS